jgi:hypothetical protein
MIIMSSLGVHPCVGGRSPGLDSFAAIRGNDAAGELRGDGIAVTETRSGDEIAALDEATLSRFHLRAVLASGAGFFTDAYDLFVIGIASTLITAQWHLSSGRLALLNSTMLAAPATAPRGG